MISRTTKPHIDKRNQANSPAKKARLKKYIRHNGPRPKKYIKLDLSEYATLTTFGRNVFNFYVCLLLKYDNGIIYNGTINNLVKLTGVSRNTATKYRAELIKQGLATRKGKQLTITPPPRTEKNKRKKIYWLYRSLNFENVGDALIAIILSENINEQTYVIDKKEILTKGSKYCSKSNQFKNIRGKQLLNLRKKNPVISTEFCKQTDRRTYNSSRSIAKRIGTTHATVLNRIHRLNNKGILKRKDHLKPILYGVSHAQFLTFCSLSYADHQGDNKTPYKRYLRDPKTGIIYLHCGQKFEYIVDLTA